MPASSKEFLDIQATIECGFTLKRIRDMTRTYRQHLKTAARTASFTRNLKKFLKNWNSEQINFVIVLFYHGTLQLYLYQGYFQIFSATRKQKKLDHLIGFKNSILITKHFQTLWKYLLQVFFNIYYFPFDLLINWNITVYSRSLGTWVFSIWDGVHILFVTYSSYSVTLFKYLKHFNVTIASYKNILHSKFSTVVVVYIQKIIAAT